MPKATTDEERKAEIAAKKSRLKQKLVKSARTVAIFSLKLKENRAREAERKAKEKADELAEEKVSWRLILILLAIDESWIIFRYLITQT